jgi:hypothetical protein
MKSVEFVEVVKKVVRDAAVSDVLGVLEAPPGRRPAVELLANSAWFKSLDSDQRKRLMSIINEAVDHAVFGLFCVIDGVRTIENGNPKGTIELRYVSPSNAVTALNPPNGEMLHDIYNSEGL